MEHLKYPIGKFDNEKQFSFDDRLSAIAVLKELPNQLYEISKSFNEDLLETRYRPEGWTGRQVFHHIADSHTNLFVRLKCALTEENPTIKGYDEALWSELSDAKLDIRPSLLFIDGLHARLVNIFENMTVADYEKTYFHNGYNRTYVLRNVLQLYKWHSLHHLEHLKIILNA